MQEKGITYDAIYKKTGLAPSSLARMLMGSTRPRFTTIEKIASALGTTPSELLSEEGRPSVCVTENDIDSLERRTSVFFSPLGEEYSKGNKSPTPEKKEPPKQDVSSLVPKYQLSNVFDRLENGGEPDCYVAAPPGVSKHSIENMLCLLATNSSMRPGIFESDLLYFEKMPEELMRSGDIVLANTRIGPVIGRLFKRNVTHLIKFDDDNSPEVERIEATSIYGIVKWLVRRL